MYTPFIAAERKTRKDKCLACLAESALVYPGVEVRWHIGRSPTPGGEPFHGSSSDAFASCETPPRLLSALPGVNENENRREIPDPPRERPLAFNVARCAEGVVRDVLAARDRSGGKNGTGYRQGVLPCTWRYPPWMQARRRFRHPPERTRSRCCH